MFLMNSYSKLFVRRQCLLIVDNGLRLTVRTTYMVYNVRNERSLLLIRLKDPDNLILFCRHTQF